MIDTLGISYDDLLREIDRLATTSPGGFTVLEMAEKTGRTRRWCREKIRILIDAGVIRYAGTARRMAIDGRPTYSPAYAYVQK
jgi:predicted transcriptional regulator